MEEKTGAATGNDQLIGSPKNCKKRHERVMHWLDVTKGNSAGMHFTWSDLNIDWASVTAEDRIIMGLIQKAITDNNYQMYVALSNSRYGMLKGGDYVDDGGGDQIDVLWEVD